MPLRIENLGGYHGGGKPTAAGCSHTNKEEYKASRSTRPEMTPHLSQAKVLVAGLCVTICIEYLCQLTCELFICAANMLAVAKGKQFLFRASQVNNQTWKTSTIVASHSSWQPLPGRMSTAQACANRNQKHKDVQTNRWTV